MADSWRLGQVSNLVRLVLGNFIHSLTLTLGTASPTTTTLTRTIPRTKSLHGPSIAHSPYNSYQFLTCFFSPRDEARSINQPKLISSRKTIFSMLCTPLACRRPGLFLASSLTMSTSNSPMLSSLTPSPLPPQTASECLVSGLRLKKVLDSQSSSWPCWHA